ncbi:MAG: sugar phosphate isomerase/epimerase [Thermomicrobiales bacterium]|nr:sugar phosphate isomerase/epimerase [Thermomicrobiales bacterium]
MEFGINLGFALKRWPEPEVWTALVRQQLGLTLVQYTLDMLDPWWPEPQRGRMAERVRRAAAAEGVAIHSAQLGIAWYTYNGLLDPNPDGRAVAREWWKRAVATTAELGARSVGGPLGALSVAAAADPVEREQRYMEMLDDVVAASEEARAAGLNAILVEPTPVPREIPSTITETARLLADLEGRTAVPIHLVLDVGHALYRPLYGNQVALSDWLAPLHDAIGVLHLQNHDYQSDAHLGWPNEHADYDVAAFAKEVREAGLANRPVILELFFPFEVADAVVLSQTISSVEHCRAALSG